MRPRVSEPIERHISNVKEQSQNTSSMTGMIQRTLEDFNQYGNRRQQIISRLIFLQIALLFMMTPLAFMPKEELFTAGVFAAGLFLFLFAWFSNSSGSMIQAQRILLIGSGAITLADMILQIFYSGQIINTALAGFPFLLTILEAGLLLSPEWTLVTALICEVSTIGALVAAIMTGTITNAGQTYLVAVAAMGLQALVAIIAWQISHFIIDISNELTQVKRQEFIGQQYDALKASNERQMRMLRENILFIVQCVTSLTRGDYTARAAVHDGELKPVADALNELANRLSSITESGQMNGQLNMLVKQIADIAGLIIEPELLNEPTPTDQAIFSANASFMQSALISQQRAWASYQRKLGLIRESALEARNILGEAAGKVDSVLTAIANDQGHVGVMRSQSERLDDSVKQLKQLTNSIEEIIQTFFSDDNQPLFPNGSAEDSEKTDALPRSTIQFDAIEEEIAAANVSRINGDIQTKLRSALSYTVEMIEEVSKSARDTAILQDNLGIATRNLRNLDGELRQFTGVIINLNKLVELMYVRAQPRAQMMNQTGTRSRPLTGQLHRPTSRNLGSGQSQPYTPDVQNRPNSVISPPFSLPVTPSSTPIVPGAPHTSQPITHRSLPMENPPRQQPTSQPPNIPIPPGAEPVQGGTINAADLIDEENRGE